MFAILYLLVLIFMTGYAVKLLTSQPSLVGLTKVEKVLLTGREKFLLFTLVTGMLQVGAFSSIRLMIWILLVILSFVIYRKLIKFNILIWVYMLFLVWLMVSLLWAPDIMYGFRIYLKYLYPLLILLFAATFVQSKYFIFIAMRQMLIVAFVLSLLLGGVMTHLLGFWGFYMNSLFWPIATFADYLGVMSSVAVVMWWRTNEKKYLWLILWFILSSFIHEVRTGLLSIGMVLIAASVLRFHLKSIPVIVGIILASLYVILHAPGLKEKMFFTSHEIQNFNDIFLAQQNGNLNTSARSTMWEEILGLFYKGSEWIGSGLGSVQHYMYENFVFGGLQVVHSDYVQLLSDVGIIGLVLYLLLPISIYLKTMRYTRWPSTGLRVSSILALLSYVAVLAAMGFDNVVNYSLPVHSYPFIFVGIFLAYLRPRGANV
jgi:O-antigen ligase